MQYEVVVCLQTLAENDVLSHRSAVMTETEVTKNVRPVVCNVSL